MQPEDIASSSEDEENPPPLEEDKPAEVPQA